MSVPPPHKPSAREKSLVAAFAGPLVLTALLFFVVWGAVSGSQPPDRPLSTANLGLLELPADVYDPVRAGEDLPDGYRQLLVRDGILPIYEPAFLTGSEVDWAPQTLVLAVAIGNEAKAYPVGFLNSREMVVDRLAGIPILVTW